MSVTVANSRFITSSFKGLYRYLTYHLSSFQALGERIIHEAKTAQAFRQTEKLEELGSILSNSHVKEYRLIGQYYIGWCMNRKGQDAQGLFEKIVEESTTYRPMALIELASSRARKADYASSIDYYTEALKYSQTPYQIVLAQRSIAAAKGIEGDHIKALKDLERIAPLVRYCQPVEQYQYLNSYAVELIEVGRIEEARNISNIILASPYTFAYPEWRETGQDLALRGYKSRSSVPIIKSIPRISGNVSFISEHERSEGYKPSPFDYPRGVSTIADWKKKMVKEPNGETPIENVDEMNDKDLLATLIQLAARDDVDEEKLRDVVKYAIKTLTKRK